MVSVCPKTEQLEKLDNRHMKSVVIVNQDEEFLAWYKQQNLFFSVRLGKFLKKFSALLFQKQETK